VSVARVKRSRGMGYRAGEKFCSSMWNPTCPSVHVILGDSILFFWFRHNNYIRGSLSATREAWGKTHGSYQITKRKVLSTFRIPS